MNSNTNDTPIDGRESGLVADCISSAVAEERSQNNNSSTSCVSSSVSTRKRSFNMLDGNDDTNTSGEMSIIPIGEKGRKVTLDDIIDTFRYVSTHERLEKFRHSGRSYFLEGFKVIKGGNTLSVTWGS